MKYFIAFLLLFSSQVAFSGKELNGVLKTVDAVGKLQLDKATVPWLCGTVVENGANGGCTTGTCVQENTHGECFGTVTWSSTGVYTVNFAASFWATAPSCTCAPGGISDKSCMVRGGAVGVTTTSAEVRTVDISLASLEDGIFSIICIGGRN